jgi:phenylpyruvate tautomerase PptA (4-oxalocrotonate tautomerase family)
MPMIDVYAESGTFSDPAALATRLAATLMEVEQVPDISLFRKNTAAFVHEGTVSNVEGDNKYVRVQVLTNAGALDRAKQLDAVSRLTTAVAEAAGDPTIVDRTWVQLTETYDGGWGLAGHANTNDELVALARAELTGS